MERWALRIGFTLIATILLIVLVMLIAGLIQQRESQCVVTQTPTPTSYFGG